MKKVLSLVCGLILLGSLALRADAAETGRRSITYPVTLQSVTRQFFRAAERPDGTTMFLQDSMGEHYGFTDAYSDACSVWCAVQTWQVYAWGSSWLPPQGRYEYLPGNLTDGSRETVWSEGVPGYGSGEYVELSYIYNEPEENNPQQFDFETICIVNGYAQNADKWRANSRVKTMDVYVNEHRMFRFELQDTMMPQYFDISAYGVRAWSGEETRFRFVIDDVYPGTQYDDTCITGIEVEFWTPNH